MTLRNSLLAIVGCMAPMVLVAQGIGLPDAEYDRMKIEGTLPQGAYPVAEHGTPVAVPMVRGGQPKGGGSGGLCDCWIEPDQTYTMVNNSTQWNAGGFHNGDDGSHGPLNLPFPFNLYGDLHTAAYININGNVSFGTYYSQFSAAGFPSNQHTMVAPFWGDVDLRPPDQNGFVFFKVTPTAFYVNWVEVGYFSQQGDKRNTFQLIITNGEDPVIGIGKNVSFCYKDMQWTTGSASGGINGFGGTAATVGANRGNGVDFIQFGRFDQPGDAYDGPFGANDGIDWLDDKNFVFTTSVSTQNIPPIASSQFLCDTIEVCVGEEVVIQMDFLSPEGDQVTQATSSAPGLANYTETTNTPGITATIIAQFSPLPGEEGFQTITFSGTDNGLPPLTSTVEIVVQVLPGPPPPTITGPDQVCGGDLAELSAGPPGFDSYTWSNGGSGESVNVGAGTYTVTITQANCAVTSEPFTVAQAPNPAPVITGPTLGCGGIPLEIFTTEPYTSYLWSTGSTEAGIDVLTGSYTVTVTNSFGCTGTSEPYEVVVDEDPTAGFVTDPPSPQLPGVTVDFTNTSQGNGGTIANWWWDFGMDGANSTDVSPTYTYDLPGEYVVTLVVTTVNGCVDTVSYVYIVRPEEIEIPNVFSPNNDGVNDAFHIVNIQYYPNTLTIFSRWGTAVYEARNYANQWRGADAPDGTYFYVLILDDGREFTGHVTLVR